MRDLTDAIDKQMAFGRRERQERVGERMHAAEAAFDVLRERPAKHRVQLLAYIAADPRDGRGLITRDRQHQRCGFAKERRPSGKHLVEDGSERPHVCPHIDIARFAHQLRRGVGREAEHRCACDFAGCVLRAADEFGGAKIGDLDERRAACALREKKMRRLKVANDDRVGVRFSNGLAGLQREQDRVRERQGACFVDVFFEIRAFEVLTYQVKRAVGFCAYVKDPRHVFGGDF